MILQPFRHPKLQMDAAPLELRDDSYTETLIALVQQQANGLDASTNTLAVTEICAGLWGERSRPRS